MSTNKPLFKLHDGLMTLTIWENPTETSSRFNYELSRSYQDEDNKWHETTSLSGSEPLQAARLYERAYDRVAQIRQERREERQQAA